MDENERMRGKNPMTHLNDSFSMLYYVVCWHWERNSPRLFALIMKKCFHINFVLGLLAAWRHIIIVIFAFSILKY